MVVAEPTFLLLILPAVCVIVKPSPLAGPVMLKLAEVSGALVVPSYTLVYVPAGVPMMATVSVWGVMVPDPVAVVGSS